MDLRRMTYAIGTLALTASLHFVAYKSAQKSMALKRTQTAIAASARNIVTISER